MRLWWLMLRGGDAAIVEAESISHAQLLAVVNDLCRASHLLDGYAIDPALSEMIPEDFLWCRLSQPQASDFLEILKEGPRKAA